MSPRALIMSSDQLNTITADKKPRSRWTWSKILETIWATWALIYVGTSDCLLGPSLLDLQALLQTDLTKLNYVVLATGLADFVGAIMAGFLTKTADINLRLSLCMLIGSISIAVCAEVPLYAYVLTMFSIHGLMRGVIFCYSIEKINYIWNGSEIKGSAFQVTSLGTTIAGVLATLTIKSFLCEEPQSNLRIQSINRLHSNDSNITQTSAVYFSREVFNGSTWNWNNTWTQNDTSEEMTYQCKPGDVRISLAYNILGGLNLPLSVMYFLYWRADGRSSEGHAEVRAAKEDERKASPGQYGRTLVFSVFFVIFYFFLLGGPIMYSTYLTEFGVNGPLRVAKTTMVLMTSAFWASSLLGRLLGIFLAPVLGMEKLIIVYLVLLLLFLTVLVFTVAHSQILFWICTCGVGLFIGIYSAAGYGWCAGVATLSPRVISASSAALGLGGMAIPFLGGMILKSFGALPFMYCLYSIYTCTALVFATLVVLSRRLKQSNMEMEIDPVNEALRIDTSSAL